MAITPESIPIGSLIIPMDKTYQDAAMWRAYGLVYALLRAGVPVQWAIEPGKLYNGTDFTVALVNDFKTGAAVPGATHTYTGGPFIVLQPNVAAATPVIQAWQAANPNVVVHVANSPFSAPIAVILNRAPRIAVEETNSGIIFDYLSVAGIRDSAGNAWSNSSPGVLDSDEVGAGALFNFDMTACRQPYYDIFVSPHTDDKTWQDTVNAGELDDYVRLGGYVHAMCHSISAIENVVGPFLTVSGFSSFPNKGDSGTFTVDIPDYPVDQAVSTAPGKPQVPPGGSEQTWLHTSVSYRTYTDVLAHFLDNGSQYDFMVGGPYQKDGVLGAGIVVYEGGHEYVLDLPYSNNAEGPFVKFFYNSIFWSVGKPWLTLKVSPTTIPTSGGATVDFYIQNEGGSNALSSTTSDDFVVHLAPNVSLPTIISGPAPAISGAAATGWILTWADFTDPMPYGNVVHFTVTTPVVPAGSYQIATFSSNFLDEYGTPFALNNCRTVRATQGAVVSLSKTLANQTASPNQNVSWTITLNNTVPAVPVTSATITDIIPAGLTYVSSAAAPGSSSPTSTTVTVLGDGRTQVVWQYATPPALTNPVTMQLTVKTPPATTKTYVNNVAGVVSDGTGGIYNPSASANLNVINHAPTVNIDNPPATVCSSPLNITWSVSDPDGDPITSIKLQYSSDGGANWVDITTIVPPAPPAPVPTSYSWNIAPPFPSGTYMLKIIASDGELPSEDTTNSFVIDNQAPTVTWQSPVTISPPVLVTDVVPVQALAKDNLGVSKVEFSYATSSSGPYSSPFAVSNAPLPNPTTFTATANWETTGLNGTYYIKATAYDGCGHTGESIVTVRVDNTPPTVVITPPSGAVNGVVTLTLTAHDNECLSTVDLYINGVKVQTFTVAAPNTKDAVFTYNWDTTGTTPPYPDDSYPVEAIVHDCVGLTGQDDKLYDVQNASPTVTIITPEKNKVYCSEVEITWTQIDPFQRTPLTTTIEYSRNSGSWLPLAGPTIFPVPTPPDPYSYTWNILSPLQPSGEYRVRITVDNGITPPGVAISDTFRIDTTAPQVKWVTPLDGATISGSAVPLSARATDNEAIDHVEFAYAPNVLPLVFTTIGNGTYDPASDHEYKFTWDTTAPVLLNGDYVLRATAYDTCGRTDEDFIDVTIDNTPPDVTIVSPPNNSNVTETVPLEITAQDNECLSKVELYIDGVLKYTYPGGGTTDLISFTYNWNTESPVAYADGPHTVRAVATDCQGLTDEQTNTYYVRNRPPEVTIENPVKGKIYCNYIDITWTVTDPNQLPTRTILIEYSANNGGSWTTLATPVPPTGSIPVPYHWDISTLDSGSQYLVRVTATNDIKTAKSVAGPFTIDNTPPTVMWVSPEEMAFLVGTVDLEALAEDDSGIQDVTFGYSTTENGLYTNIATIASSPYKTPWNTTTVADGIYYLRALATDKTDCHHEGYDIIQVTVDNTPPKVDIISPPDGSTVSGITDLVITASDNECLSKVELYIDGKLVETVDNIEGKEVEFTYKWDTNLETEEEHVVTAIAYDCAGHTATTENTYIVDNLPDHYVQVIVDGELTIPDQKPDMERINDLTVCSEVTGIKVFRVRDGAKLLITGRAQITVTYTANVSTQDVHVAHYTVPFKDFILWPGLSQCAELEPVIVCEHIDYEMLDSRSISKHIVLFIGVRDVY